MESILKNLYYGKLNMDELLYAKNPEYGKLNDQVLEILELLKRNVSDNDFNRISKLLELHTESEALETADAFVYGFKYGTLIMLEVLKDKD